MIVAVDQFEETFTACRDESERAAFVDALVAAARDPRRRALVLVAVRADFYGRCAAYPELARLLGASHVLVGADAPRRAAPRDRAARAGGRAAGRARARGRADRRRRGRAGRAAAAVDGAARAVAAPRRPRPAPERLRARGRRAAARSRGWPSAPTRGSTRPRRELARRILLRLAGEGDGDAVVRRRVPLDRAGGRPRPARRRRARRARRRAAWSRSATGEAEVAHEALLREWPRLRGWLEEDAEGAAAAPPPARTPRASGTPAAATRASSTAARGSPRRSTGPPTHDGRAQRGRARVPRRQPRARASARSARAARAVLAGVGALLVLAVIAGVVALDQRASARAEATAADGPAARRPGARRRRPRPVAAARPPGRRARRLACRRAATCWRRCCAAPGGDRRAARRRRRAGRASPSARTSGRWRSSTSTAR